MPERRTTMLDVARRAAVSRTTVSFVLAGREDMRISQAARERVLRAAAELGYRPNLTARSLVTSVSRTIALVSDTLATEPYGGQLVAGSLTASVQRGHMLFVAETAGDPAVEARLVDDLLDRQVDGFLYATAYTRSTKVPSALVGQPLVLLNCFAEDTEVPAVVPDERAGGRSAARALLDAGHRDGIHLLGERADHVVAGRERLRGITETLAEAGTALAGVLECAWWPGAAYDALTAFLADHEPPAALICLNDRIALGAYQALARAHLRIPQDVSVVSFDDSELAAWLQPGLTSVALPHRDLGARAVELLLDPGPVPAAVERLRMPLTRRGSISAR